MKFGTHLFIVVMLLLTAFSYAGTLPTYDVVELNVDMPEFGKNFIPTGINDKRQVTGDFTPAYLIDNGKWIKLKDNSKSVDVNNLGQVTLWSLDPGRFPVGLLLDKGEFINLDGPVGDYPYPLKINDKGQIVGSLVTADIKTHAFLWENGIMKDLGTLNGDSGSCALDINENGQIVGYSFNESGKKRVFLYENGEMHDIGIEGTPYGINDSGQILIYQHLDELRKIFIWENGKLLDTEIDVTYYPYSFTLGEKGQVLVEYIYWTKESGPVNIKDLLPEYYRDASIIYHKMNRKDEIVCNSIKGISPLLFVPSSLQAVIPPLFTYKSGLYSEPIQVKITSPTENAVIHYTTNGTDPTEADPVIESGGTVLIDKDTTLKAKAWRSDCKPSGVREGEFKIRQKTWKGLAMVSVPTIPFNADPKLAAGFSNNYWYAYNATAKAYTGYPDQYTWFDLTKDNRGRAFWAKFNTETPIPEGNFLYRYYCEIDLKPGWNMIGQPFISAIKWDTSKISASANGFGGQLKDASGYVYPFIWGWKQSMVNPFTGTYYRVGDPSVYPDAIDTMEPFEGYWIKAKKECTLRFDKPE